MRLRRNGAPERPARRQSQHRLDASAVAELIDGYLAGAKIKDLAQRFGVHRTTVTCLLRRHNVQPRPVGLSPGQLNDTTRLYREGWSLAKLGDKFGVDDMTERRYLLLADVAIRSPHKRPPKHVKPNRDEARLTKLTVPAPNADSGTSVGACDRRRSVRRDAGPWLAHVGRC